MFPEEGLDHGAGGGDLRQRNRGRDGGGELGGLGLSVRRVRVRNHIVHVHVHEEQTFVCGDCGLWNRVGRNVRKNV